MIDFKVCEGCKQTESIEAAAEFIDNAKTLANGATPLIDSAMELVTETDKLDDDNSRNHHVDTVIGVTASLSGISNMFDPEIIIEMEEQLKQDQCNEGQRLVSPIRCPKLDFLMERIVTLT